MSDAWRYHEVHQLVPEDHAHHPLPARLHMLSEPWDRTVAVPILAYVPDIDRLVMSVGCDYPHKPYVIISDDHGTTWTQPKPLGPPDVRGLPVATSRIQGNTVLIDVGEQNAQFISDDGGETWRKLGPIAPNGSPNARWDPRFVDRDPETGQIRRIFDTSYRVENGIHQAYLRTTTGLGQPWSKNRPIPQWRNANEVLIIRAANGDLVAACRTVAPPRYAHLVDGPVPEADHWEGLAVSISTDDGQTWSSLNLLYEIGRHHPSMVLLPDGTLVMTYVVRKGYPKTPDGHLQFGIEAIVSRDHGQTWDLDHPFLLHRWPSNRQGENAWWASSQATSSVLLPDGSILTAFGTGYRSQSPAGTGQYTPRDVGLINWRLPAESAQ